MFSGHLVTLIYPGHFNKIGAIAFLPLAFGSFYKAIYSQKLRNFIICGFALAMQLLASHFQIFYYTILLIIFFLIYHFFFEMKNKKEIFAIIAGLILCLIIAITISAIQLFPAIELSHNSNRSGGVSYEECTASSFPPEELTEIIFPRLYGDSLIGEKGFFLKSRGDYNGRWKERIVSDYIGMVSYVFLFIGLFYSKRKEKFFFIFILIFAVILCLGKFSAVFKIFYLVFPGIKMFRTPASIMILITFSITLLSAFGLEKIFQFVQQKEALQKGFIKKYLLFFASIFVISYLVSHLVIRFSELHNVILNYKNIAYARFQAFTFLILTAIILFIFLISKKNERNKKATNLFLIGLFLISFLDLSFNNIPFIQTTPFSSYSMFLYGDPFIQSIYEESRPIRVIELGNELTNRFMPSKITSIHGYHPIWLKDYKRLIDKLGFYNPTLFNLFNVRYIISRQPIDSDMFVLKNNSYGKYVYSLSQSIPYVYFPQNIKIFYSDKKNKEQIKDEILSKLENEYLINSTLGIVEIPKQKEKLAIISENSIPKAELVNYTPDKIELSVDTKESATMIISEVYEKNWKCFYNDTQKLEIYPANFLFRAVEVPAGKGKIIFIYDPLSYHIGKYISVLALIVFAIIMVILEKKS